MTPIARLARLRWTVAAALALKVILLGAVAGAAVLIAASAFDTMAVLPRGGRVVLVAMAASASVVAIVILARRALRIRSNQALALWVESQYPLDYLLVTAVDRRFAGNRLIDDALASRPFEPVARRAAWRGVRTPMVAALLLGGILAVIPGRQLERVVRPAPGDLLDARPRGQTSRLRPLVVRYRAPDYAGGAVITLEDPTTVRGLEAGAVEVTGRGTAPGVTGMIESREVVAEPSGDQWRLRLIMPGTPIVVRLRGDGDERLLALEPIRDSVPSVTLRFPAGDTVVQSAAGVLTLEAALRDDIGLRGAWFEYIVSSGVGELFEFRTGAAGRRNATGRVDSLRATLDLDALALKPGDVLHLRAVAADHGPAARGVGSSDTRTLRVARRDESDTSAVIVLPPLPADTAALSQRMLIQLAEALEARRSRLARSRVLEESQAISRDQAALRRGVADVIFMRLAGEAPGEEQSGDEPGRGLTPEELLAAAEAATAFNPEEALDFAEDESPVVAVNRPLLEAYNAMWDATRELDVGEPGRALPPMRVALEAIQRARAAERIYLRGRAPRVVVNLAQVRLSGKRENLVTRPRVPGPPGSRAARLERFFDGIALMENDPSAARDSLLVLRIELLVEEPGAAVALSEAIAALRAGTDPFPFLAVARGALGGSPTRGDIGAWGTGGRW